MDQAEYDDDGLSTFWSVDIEADFLNWTNCHCHIVKWVAGAVAVMN